MPPAPVTYWDCRMTLRVPGALLDCAPGITLTSESVFGAADALIVPTIPTTLSERTVDQLTGFLSEHPPAPMVLPFASMLDRRKRLQRDIVAHLMADVAGFLPTAIPNASVIEQMGIQRSPIALPAQLWRGGVQAVDVRG